MARTIINLMVILDYDEDQVRNDEGFGVEPDDTPERYLQRNMAGFVENEINNTYGCGVSASVFGSR